MVITQETFEYGLIVFIIVIFAYLAINIFTKFVQQKSEKLAQRIQGATSTQEKEKSFVDNFFDKLEKELKEAEIKMDARSYALMILAITVVVYVALYFFTGTFLVPLAILPFPLYFIPVMIMDTKREKIMARFDQELILVLRRMSSITKNDSILKALEDVKDYPAYSQKMRFILNKIYALFSYGNSIEDSFLIVSQEVASEDFRRVAIAISIDKALGADLSLSLHEISATISDDNIKLKKVKSMLASSKVSARFLSIAPYCLVGFMMKSMPTFADYMTTTTHQLIVTAILGLMGFGVFYVNSLLRPQKN